MKISEILPEYKDKIDYPFNDLDIASLSYDSRKTESGSLFFALKGELLNGNHFIDEAVTKGAQAIVYSGHDVLLDSYPNFCFVRVDDVQKVLKTAAVRFYRKPSSQIRVIGVTGTNGKTTTTYLLESIFHADDKSCGVIGTVNYRIGERVLPAGNTTPGILENQKLLSDLVEDGVEYCFMEVSSHALYQGRVDLIDFRTAIFTNLTGDHLDYHKTMDNYFEAKAILFKNLSADAHAVVNADDAYGRKLFSKTEAKIITYGIVNEADVMATDLFMDIAGSQFKLTYKDDEIIIRTSLVGAYNVYNILSASSAALAEGITLDKIKKGIEMLGNVPGRLEKVDCGQEFSVFVDYAHTHDALENVLRALRKTCGSRILVVFGCGGDRDKSKRPAMGKVACELADFSIVTNDNPRTEDPENIIRQIVDGFEKDNYEVIEDRKLAIQKALSMAQKGDIVLIAGKGHETYQIFKDKRISFDERKIVREFILC